MTAASGVYSRAAQMPRKLVRLPGGWWHSGFRAEDNALGFRYSALTLHFFSLFQGDILVSVCLVFLILGTFLLRPLVFRQIGEGQFLASQSWGGMGI